MKPHFLAVALVSLVLSVAGAVPFAQAPGPRPDTVDLADIQLIKDEGLQRSKVMEIASYLTDVYGPRLTGSPDIRRAGEWAVKELQSWGLATVKLEPWTGFGRGWTNERFSAHMTAPATSTLIGYPKAWTPGTNGVVKGEAMVARLDSPSDLDR